MSTEEKGNNDSKKNESAVKEGEGASETLSSTAAVVAEDKGASVLKTRPKKSGGGGGGSGSGNGTSGNKIPRGVKKGRGGN